MKQIHLLLASLLLLAASFAQKTKNVAVTPSKSSSYDVDLLGNVKYRLLGPFRGGRSGAVTGSYKSKNTFYFGATGGGVWKTTDGGSNWKNISDKYFGGTIGAVEVAPSNENVIYVGEGENTMRGNVAEGLGGMWKSEDAGKTWKNIGLKDGRHITNIIIHPDDANTLWVGVMGHLFGPNNERGIFKSTDGGKSWKKVLFVNEQTGCSDLVMEPGNPSVLYAGTWRLIRTPYSLESGGEGSGLWKSVDGGDTWTNITASKGLPKGIWGIVGVAVAPSNTDKIYAIIENEKGGLYMSDDGGKTWNLQSSDNNIRQRAWYYTKVFVDPKNENLVYCPNVNFMKSRDGGKTFQSLRTPHGDHHDLWIDPVDGKRMIVADDGGAQISFDEANSWSTYMNQPTSQLYRVSTDNSFPYRVLAAQQDNSTLRIKSATYGSYITEQDWDITAGSESGYVVADPTNSDLVYGGNYGGYLSRLDHRTGENRAVSVWPDNPMGAGADVLKFRFQWNFPIFFSPHNPKKLYAAGNALFVTENEGASWKQISPDLTTNDKAKQVSSGGPITKDNTSVEYYCTIFTATESSLEKDLLWAGSDDGLLYISRDGGTNWSNVTPKDAPKWMMWNAIDIDPFKKGAAYITGTRYKLDDFTPYVYKTEDYGQTWKLITNGIDPMHFTRVMRADHKRPGLLYAGTEYGMYISYNDGASWNSFQLNLPVVPITDLTIKNNDLIVATQGRALWVIDDLSVLQQMDPAIKAKKLHAYQTNPSYRIPPVMGRWGMMPGTPANAALNPPKGAVINFYAGAVTDTSNGSVAVYDKNKKLISRISTDDKTKSLKLSNGSNQFVWDMQYPSAERLDDLILWNGVPGNITAIPGNYTAVVRVDKDSVEVPFTLLADPNYQCSQADYDAQLDFLLQVQGKFNETMKAIKQIRSARTQMKDFVAKQGKDCPKEIRQLSDSLGKSLTSIEEKLHQTKAKSGQDVLNYPIRLDDKLGGVFDMASSGNMAPSKQSKDVYAELAVQVDAEITKLKSLLDSGLKSFNKMVRERELPTIIVSQ
ncbi:MAG: WD40/YVTN/BNR-like repeat-containing protein [Bacteroidota bacterium]